MPEPFPPPGFISTPSAIQGIEVYMPAPADATPHAEVVEFKCPQCGANTAFSAADGGLTCSHCGYYEAPDKTVVGRRAQKFEFTVETMQQAAEAPQDWDTNRKEMACQDCGALTSVPPENLTHTCPFCGSNKVIQREAPQDVLRPRYLIPFKLETTACANLARTWMGSSWMTPASLRSNAMLSNFTAIYLPYWTFGALTKADWRAEVGHDRVEYYYDRGERKQRTVTDWRWESGNVQLKIEDLLVAGASRLSALLLDKIKNFEMSSLAPYEAKYLAGLQAQGYDIPLEKAWETGRQEMRERTRQACVAQASTSKVRNFSMSLNFANEAWRYILLPVYLNTYHYEGKVFQIMVNGQTGAVSGQRPVDWNKIWLAVAVLLSPGILLGLVGLITSIFGFGIFIAGFGFVLLIIGVILSGVIIAQANTLDDA